MQEQEPSVNEILSSIRQILTNKIDGESLDQPPVTQNDVFVTQTHNHAIEMAEPQEDGVGVLTEDVLLLTPDMVIGSMKGNHHFNVNGPINDKPVVSDEITPTIPFVENEKSLKNDQMEQVNIPVTPDQLQARLKPQIDAWLDKNLPQIVERIVSEEVRRIFNKR